MNREDQHFARRTATLFAGLFIPLVLSFPTTVLVARALGPADKGSWTLCIQALFVAETVGAIGGGTYYALEMGRGRPLSDVYGTSLLQSLLVPVSLFLVGTGLGLTSLVPHPFSEAPVVGLLAVTLILLVASRQLTFMLIGLDRAHVYTSANAAWAGIQLVLVLALFLQGMLTVTSALAAWSIGVLVRFLLPFAYITRRERPSLRFRLTILVEAVRFGWRRSISEVEDAVNTRLPLFLLPLSRPLSTVGVYTIAIGLVEVVGQVGFAISLASIRLFAGDTRRGAAIVTRVSVLVSFLLALMSVPVAFAIPTIFGSSYRDASVLLLELLPTIPLLALNRVLAVRLSAAHRLSVVAAGGIASLATMTIVTLLLGSSLGATGATIGLTLGLGTQAALFLREVCRHDRIPVSELTLPRRLDVHRVASALRSLVTAR